MIERATRFPRTNGFLPEVYQEPEKRLQIKPDFFRLFSGFPSFFHLFSTSLSHVAELICHLSLAGKRVKNKLAVLLMYETFLVFLPAGPGDHHVGKHRQINSRDIYVQGLSDFFKTALRQKPYATQVRYMSHCDIPFPKLSTPGY